LRPRCLKAEQQDTPLECSELPQAGFDLVVATRKSRAPSIDLDASPDALVLPLAGGRLALSFEDAGKMIAMIDTLQRPGCSFQTARHDGLPAEPVSVYVVPSRQSAADMRTASLDARLPPPGNRKVEVPGQDFAIVFTTTSTPVNWTPHEAINHIAVYWIYSPLLMAMDGEAELMFK